MPQGRRFPRYRILSLSESREVRITGVGSGSEAGCLTRSGGGEPLLSDRRRATRTRRMPRGARGAPPELGGCPRGARNSLQLHAYAQRLLAMRLPRAWRRCSGRSLCYACVPPPFLSCCSRCCSMQPHIPSHALTYHHRCSAHLTHQLTTLHHMHRFPDAVANTHVHRPNTSHYQYS